MLWANISFGQRTLVVQSLDEEYALRDYATILADSAGKLDIEQILSKEFRAKFRPATQSKNLTDAKVHWLHFWLTNKDSSNTAIAGISFTDDIRLYFQEDGKKWVSRHTGDLFTLSQREIHNGQMVFLKFPLCKADSCECYVRLESKTAISWQFKDIALKSIHIYTPLAYQRLFMAPRPYQLVFYGALIIMILYNLIIFFILRSVPYLYYNIYGFGLLIFLASNSGYLAEHFFQDSMRLDLYIRFLSAPFLLCFYLMFSRSYLHPREYAPRMDKLLKILIFTFPLIAISMMAGAWAAGRTLVIFTALFSFAAVFVTAIKVLRNGYTPARFFLAANVLLILGGAVFALERISIVVHNPFTQYSLQVASILELALFSVGLADRINLSQKKLTEQTLENEMLKVRNAQEQERIIREKNIELEIRVMDRTAEVEQQKSDLQSKNQELEAARSLISEKNTELASINIGLERKVRERTKELDLTNSQLEKTIRELNIFIYRTSHDLRGPVASLMGLINAAKEDLTEPEASAYVERFSISISKLDRIMNRISTLYNINRQELALEAVNLNALLHEVIDLLSENENFDRASFNLAIPESTSFITDIQLLSFILSRLLENALQFQKPGSEAIEIDVKIELIEEKCLISISDYGVGIPEKDRNRIFDIFTLAASSSQNHPGLGLYTARACALRLGGDIQLNKNNISGTEFIITLPNN